MLLRNMGSYRVVGNELGADFSEYSLRFVADLAGKTLSPKECAQTLEDQLVQRFPLMPSEEIFGAARKKYTNMREYCHFLCEVGEKQRNALIGVRKSAFLI